MAQVQIYVAMNEEGACGVAVDNDAYAKLQLEKNYGAAMIRLLKIDLTMEPPKTAVVSVSVPDDAVSTIDAAVEAVD
jgi:hypothetical protein